MPPKRTKRAAVPEIALEQETPAVDSVLLADVAEPAKKRAANGRNAKTTPVVADAEEPAPAPTVVVARKGRAKKSAEPAEAADAQIDEAVGAKKPRTAAAQTLPSATGNGVAEAPDVLVAASKPIKKARAPAKKKEAVQASAAASAEVQPQADETATTSKSAKKARAPKKKAEAAEDASGTKSDAVVPAKKAKRATKPVPAETNGNDDDEVQPIAVSTAKPAKRPTKQKPSTKANGSDDIVEEDEDVAKVAPAKKTKRAPKKAAAKVDHEDEDDDEPEVIKSAPSKSRTKKTVAPAVVVETAPTPASPIAGKRPKAAGKKTAASATSNDSDATETVSTKGRAKGRKASKAETATIANDAPVAVVSPKPTKAKGAARAKSPDKTVATNGVALAAAPDGPLGHMVVRLKRSEERSPTVSAAVAKPVTSFGPSNDKPYTLKLSSWNVAGLRAMCKKDGMSFVQQQAPDIFCMQEIKCVPDQVPEEAKVKGYHYYWNALPGGHAGVALLTKNMPYHVHYGFDEAAGQLEPDGRVITAEYNKFFVVCVYVPNSGRKLVRLDERLEWNERFREHLVRLNGRKPVIVCGDLNVSHTPIDLANPKSNTMSAGFTVQERAGMDDLLASGFVDTFRRLYPDRTAAYTYWTYMANARAKNVGWRLDYFLTSERLADKVTDNVICSSVMGSDHCPITLFINI